MQTMFNMRLDYTRNETFLGEERTVRSVSKKRPDLLVPSFLRRFYFIHPQWLSSVGRLLKLFIDIQRMIRGILPSVQLRFSTSSCEKSHVQSKERKTYQGQRLMHFTSFSFELSDHIGPYYLDNLVCPPRRISRHKMFIALQSHNRGGTVALFFSSLFPCTHTQAHRLQVYYFCRFQFFPIGSQQTECTLSDNARLFVVCLQYGTNE